MGSDPRHSSSRDHYVSSSDHRNRLKYLQILACSHQEMTVGTETEIIIEVVIGDGRDRQGIEIRGVASLM